jgi:hypothetical protein
MEQTMSLRRWLQFSPNRYVPNSVAIQTTVVPGNRFLRKVDWMSRLPCLIPLHLTPQHRLIKAQRNLIMGQINWNYRVFAADGPTSSLWQYTKISLISMYDRGPGPGHQPGSTHFAARGLGHLRNGMDRGETSDLLTARLMLLTTQLSSAAPFFRET